MAKWFGAHGRQKVHAEESPPHTDRGAVRALGIHKHDQALRCAKPCPPGVGFQVQVK